MNIFGRCALPEQLNLDATLARWRKTTIRWCITGRVVGVTDDAQIACYADAFEKWRKACEGALKFEYTESSSAADILMGSGVIDGRGGTLAWSELPNGTDGRLRQQYESNENWSAALQKGQPGTPLLITSMHEIGHALGLGHSSDRGALMYPSLNTNAWTPQADDIRELVSRYGKGPGIDPPPPTPTGGIVLKLYPDSKEIEVPSGWRTRNLTA